MSPGGESGLALGKFATALRQAFSPPTPKRTPIKDHPHFKKLKFLVLAQTEEDLILGVQTSNSNGWDHPSRNTHHLPFLWKVSKREILKRLEPDSGQ